MCEGEWPLGRSGGLLRDSELHVVSGLRRAGPRAGEVVQKRMGQTVRLLRCATFDGHSVEYSFEQAEERTGGTSKNSP